MKLVLSQLECFKQFFEAYKPETIIFVYRNGYPFACKFVA